MTQQEKAIARFREETGHIAKTTTILLCVFAAATIGLFIASFIAPPLGVINSTVLKAAALLFAFATLVEAREAIREGLGVKLTHGATTIEVHDLDGNPSIQITDDDTAAHDRTGTRPEVPVSPTDER